MDKILIIHDANTSRENLKTALESLPYQVLATSNNQEGLKLFHTEEPFLVIVDSDLQNSGAMEFIQHLIEAEVPSHKQVSHYSSPAIDPNQRCLTLREANFYVVVLADMGSRQLMQKLRDLGVDYFLNKPIHLYTLQGIINTIHRLKTTRDDLCQRFGLGHLEL